MERQRSSQVKAGVFAMLTFLLVGFASAQSTDRYFVYFKDKGASTQAYTLSAPEAFLSPDAILRRAKEGITIDSTDLPVNANYIAGVQNAGAQFFFASKWLNGALVEASEFTMDQVKNLDYVDRVRLIARGSRLQLSPESTSSPTSFEEPSEILGDTDIQLMMLGADIMHMDSIQGQGMRIAVFDNGFTGADRYTPFQHLWESNLIVATKDFVENSGNVYQFGSHGTAVFSIIGARYSNDSLSFTGIANEAEFVLCITEDDKAENTIEEYNWVLAAEYADSLGVDIINSSLGYRTFDIPGHNYTFEDLDGNTAIITKAAEMAASKGIIVVSSAGNSGRRTPPGNLINHPSDADSVLIVGSVNAGLRRSSFSSVGPTTDGRIKPDVCAFGDGTAVVRRNGDIERGGGTSFAAPLIAGFAAGIWQSNPDWTSQQVIEAIKMSGHNAESPDSLLGYGVPNYVFINDTTSDRSIDVNDILEDKITFYPNPFSGEKLYFTSSIQFESPIQIRILDPKGAYIYNRSFQPDELVDVVEIPIDSIQQGVYYLFLQSEETQRVVKLINF